MKGKVAVITGASRGIGHAIARRLGADGAQLVLVARSAEPLERACEALRTTGTSAIAVAADLRESAAIPDVYSAVMRAHGRVDILINCAGAARVGDFLALGEEDWADGFALKFSGTRRLCAAFWPQLRAASGSILNIVGGAGRTPGINYALGGSVNAALLALTKALAELGIQDGVQVNAINPGPVRTDRLAGQFEQMAAAQQITVEAAAIAFVKAQRMIRLGEPADIAGLAAFVVSPAGRLFQGALLDMDGGQTKSI